MPPPYRAELPLIVQLLTVRVACSFKMPPPESPVALPFVIVRPEMVTLVPEPT